MKKILNLIKSPELVLFTLIFIYIIYFTTASFLRYDNFYTGRFDLGNMDQTVWNTINGRIFQASNDDGSIVSRLSSHADFMLILLSPFYLIWSHPKMLLLIQSFVLGIGAIFVFLIAKGVLENKTLALVFSFLYLMSPAMQFTNLYDFHPVTIATTTLLAAFYFLLKQKYFLMILFLLLSGLAKEQILIINSIFGLFLLFKIKRKILGLLIVLFSLIIFFYLIWVAIPANAGGQHFALSYYSDFGDSPGEVIRNVVFSPQKIISTILEGGRIDYLRQLFMPLGFISFFAPVYLIFAAPDLLINLLSNNSQLHQIYYQYSATITPFIFISSIFGVRQFVKWFPKIPKFYITSYLLIFTLFSAYFFGPLPGAKNPNIDMFIKPLKDKITIENFLSQIPEKYSVAATNNLGSHLSQRQTIYTIPYGVDKADMVLFLKERSELIDNVKKNKNYSEVLKIDDFIAFKRK